MPADEDIRVERRGACAWVTLDRPPLNLLTPQLIETLADTFMSLASDESVRAAVISGAGRHLTGGMQIEERSASSVYPPVVARESSRRV